jgi:tRNA A-37 threonylcarbamoyl transferase component Bud32
MSRFVHVRTGGLTWSVRDKRTADGLRRLLENPEAFLTDPANHLKNSRVTTVSRIVLPEAPASGLSPHLVLKRLNYGKFRHRLRDAVRISRAVRALRTGVLLEAAGIATARALAAATVRRAGWPQRAYLVTEAVPGARTLLKVLAAPGTKLRPAAEVLAELLARMHEAGFSNRDLNGSNILFDATGRPWLIDLDGVRRCVPVSATRAAKDLASLAGPLMAAPRATARLRLHFLKHYAACRGGGDWRNWWHLIAGELEKRGRKRRRQFRPGRSSRPENGADRSVHRP